MSASWAAAVAGAWSYASRALGTAVPRRPSPRAFRACAASACAPLTPRACSARDLLEERVREDRAGGDEEGERHPGDGAERPRPPPLDLLPLLRLPPLLLEPLALGDRSPFELEPFLLAHVTRAPVDHRAAEDVVKDLVPRSSLASVRRDGPKDACVSFGELLQYRFDPGRGRRGETGFS